MDEGQGRKALTSNRIGGGAGRPPPADFAALVVKGWSKSRLEARYSVSGRTVHRWWCDPDVLREVSELRREIRDEARAKVLGLTPLAVDTLEHVMRDGEHEPAKVKAAEAVLRIGGIATTEAEEGAVDEGASVEEQARQILAVAATILRDRGAVEAAALVEGERDRIVPDAALNIISAEDEGDETSAGEVGDE